RCGTSRRARVDPAARSAIESDGFLERVRQPLEPPAAHRDDLERGLEAVELWVGCEPRLGGLTDPALLLGADHRERVAEAVARLRLDLAEDEAAAAANDQVELVAA